MYLEHSFSPEDYRFPRLYIVSEDSEDVITLFPERECYIRGRRADGIPAGLVPYESGWNVIFDPVRAKVVRSFAVVVPWLDDRAIYVEKDVEVTLVEVSGAHVNLVAREGCRVDPKDVLAYVVTNKGETRTLRVGTRGLVVYIAWEPASLPERYVYLVTDPDNAKLLRPSC